MNELLNDEQQLQETARQVKLLAAQLMAKGRTDLLLKALSVPVLEQLRIEAARSTLSQLIITSDFKFQLPAYGKEVAMNPVHKAIYIFFLKHPEGIEFKNLVDHKKEIAILYRKIGNRLDEAKAEDTIRRLVNPLDNAINEKCSRIKAAFMEVMDEYQADYYIINSHVMRHHTGASGVWFERLKVVNLPRELVVWQCQI